MMDRMLIIKISNFRFKKSRKFLVALQYGINRVVHLIVLQSKIHRLFIRKTTYAVSPAYNNLFFLAKYLYEIQTCGHQDQ